MSQRSMPYYQHIQGLSLHAPLHDACNLLSVRNWVSIQEVGQAQASIWLVISNGKSNDSMK